MASYMTECTTRVYLVVVAAVSSIHDLICRKFRLSMEADVLTSVFISMAIAPTPTAYVIWWVVGWCVFFLCSLFLNVMSCHVTSTLFSSKGVPSVTTKFDTPMVIYIIVLARILECVLLHSGYCHEQHSAMELIGYEWQWMWDGLRLILLLYLYLYSIWEYDSRKYWSNGADEVWSLPECVSFLIPTWWIISNSDVVN